MISTDYYYQYHICTIIHTHTHLQLNVLVFIVGIKKFIL
jgi:hypothetical protein